MILPGQFVDQFAADQLDRRQGGAKFMRGGSDNTTKVGQGLFTGEGHLSGEKRIRQGAYFGRNAPGVKANEANSDGQRQPETKLENRWNCQGRPIGGAERHIKERQNCHQQDRQGSDDQGRAQGQGGCRNGNGCQNQQGERVGEAACQKQKQAELQKVE